MKLSEQVQHLIHEFEVGRFSRRFQFVPVAVAVIALAFFYDLGNYRNFSSPEPMDAAQVARNVADGRGYTTDFIRPFSVYLVKKHNFEVHAGEMTLTNVLDLAQLNGSHPDLANAPVYPTLLAGLFKLWSPVWKVETRQPFWSSGGKFLRYKPEFYIAILNQFLLLVVVALTFFVARKLFDVQTAWLAALLTLGADILWRFSVSGQSTLLLLAIFLFLVWTIARIEELGREELLDTRRLFSMAVLAGIIAGAGMLTRYAFGWVMVPVAIYLALFGGMPRRALALTTFFAFAVTVTPWIVRNILVSGTWFGTAGYAIMEGSPQFPGSKLMQSLNPDLPDYYYFWARYVARKLIENIRLILQGDLLRLAGGWIFVLFLVGLLLGLRSITAHRLRYFTLMCLGVFLVAQALGQTSLSTISPDINSENLLVLLVPLVAIFGVAFFITLLNQMSTPSLGARLVVVALLIVVSCQSLTASLFPPWPNPVSYPPYYPPDIQKISNWMDDDELLMSDVPWAVAWYGHHQCAWTTINAGYEFILFHKSIKPVRGLYLTLNTLDQKFLSDCIQGTIGGWGNFVYYMVQPLGPPNVPVGFPLAVIPYQTLTSGLFLTDRVRWKTQ
jgi:hypothetical protein